MASTVYICWNREEKRVENNGGTFAQAADATAFATRLNRRVRAKGVNTAQTYDAVAVTIT